MKKEILFWVFIVALLLPCYSQTSPQNYTTAYNLHFSMKPTDIKSTRYTWMRNASYFLYNAIPNGFKSFSATNQKKLGDYIDEYEQRILLPPHKEKEGTVTLEYSEKNMKEVSLQLTGISETERDLFTKEQTFVTDDMPGKLSCTISLIGVELLNIRIRAVGKKGETSVFELKKLDIKLGEKNIDSYPLRTLPALPNIETDKCPLLQTTTTDRMYETNAMKGHRIVALGESVHGNRPIQTLANKLIMEQVEKRHCKLIILEIPIEKSLIYNRYITDERFTLRQEEIKLIDETRMELLDKLRKYNFAKSATDKVRIFGMDYISTCNPNPTSASELRISLLRLTDDTSRLPEMKQLAELLDNVSKGATDAENKAIDYIQSHKQILQTQLTADEVDCLLHTLSVSQNLGKERAHRSLMRDSVMFVNADYLLNRHAASSNAVIYAHSVHVNPISTYPVVSRFPFGKYMKNKYQDDYTTFLLLTDEGSIAVNNTLMNKTTMQLQTPPTGSMELYFNKKQGHVLYLPLTSQWDRLVLSRFKGNVHSRYEFYPYNLYRRYKGVFFIRGN